jgi:BirA family transcriptional regulator, biotin operon repressor / biotin---[acetyl-CoA-carboxylase] ligase
MSALGRPRLHLRQIGSTNDRARELASAGAPHGTLVTASSQTAGRGRQGRRWTAPPGSALLMSLLLRWPTSDRSPPLLPLIAAVAVCDVAGEQARIKWPNDIVFVRDPHPAGQRLDPLRGTAQSSTPGQAPVAPAPVSVPALTKLAGILAEGRPQAGWAVLGIGLNVAVRLEDLPPELRSTAATLGRPQADVEPTLQRLLVALEHRLTESSAATLEAWRARDALLGREIAWGPPSSAHPTPEPIPPGDWSHVPGEVAATGDPLPAPVGRGRAAGIDGLGRLVVALSTGGHTTLQAGEVHLQSPA